MAFRMLDRYSLDPGGHARHVPVGGGEKPSSWGTVGSWMEFGVAQGCF